MRFFFSSKQFKIIVAVMLSIIAIGVLSMLLGSRISPQSDIVGTITAPFKAAFTHLSNSVSDFVSVYKDGSKAQLENTELQTELNELRQQIADYEKITKENEFYKKYLEIKENNPDFKFEPAYRIARDKLDPYKSFTIDKGSLDGVSKNDPVITDAGLVGYISEVGLTTSKVATVLSPDITLGALGNRTNDSGIVSGTIELADSMRTKFFNLSRSCNIAIGDYVVTSGEGIFPAGLLVGEIKAVGSDTYNTSIYAEVEPFADIENIREVMVITDFEGKGGLNAEGGLE